MKHKLVGPIIIHQLLAIVNSIELMNILLNAGNISADNLFWADFKTYASEELH